MGNFRGLERSALHDRIGSATGTTAVEDCFFGTALFADITAYTNLAEDYCLRGAEGVEQLARFLDRAFRRYVDCVNAAGGEIACLAGDALLAYWPTTDSARHDELAQAAECARTLHNASLVGLSGRGSQGSLHIGIATGELWAARLGGVDARWHLLLAGEAVGEATRAAVRAAPGETVVDGAARQLPASRAAARPGAREPPGVREATGGGRANGLPQLRNICALFVRIDGLDDTAAGRLERHQEAVHAALTALRPYSGSAGTLVYDDKGLVLKVCLGLPHDTHVDDALRAVSGGLAIDREMQRHRFAAACGVAAGRGICMPTGTAERQQYVAVGRFMHIAARLMEHAESGVVCTDEIADRVRGEFTLAPEGRVALKGIRGPIRAFRARGEHRSESRPERVFGREFEKRQLEAQLDAVAEGKGRVVWLVGEAGIGKTALIRDFLGVAAERGFRCLLGSATSVDTAVPYLAWRPVLSEILRRTESSGEAPDRDALRERLKHPQLAPLINTIVPGYFEESDFVDKLSVDARADAIVRVMSETIGICGPRPLIIVLEDCHWMDSASWRLVQRVAQDHPDALLILTSRPAPEWRELDTLKNRDGFLELPLNPLRRDAVTQLVEYLLESEIATRELVEEIAERSACNPLFILEYTRLLEATRQDRLHDLRHRTSTAWSRSAEPLPETVEGLIASRLDALSPDEDRVLKSASVLGEQFSTELLRAMYEPEAGRQDLGATLASLVRQELLAEVGANGQMLAFRHTLIRQGAYEQLTASQRRQLHRAAAEAIERFHSLDTQEFVAALAHHWFIAAVPERAVEYGDRAARFALGAGAYLEADRLLAACIDINARNGGGLVPHETTIRWFRQSAEARRGMGQLESRAAAAREALSRAGCRRPNNRVLLTLQATGRAFMLAASPALPRDTAGKVPVLALEIAQAYRHSAEVCYFNNDMIGMICDSISSVQRARAAPPSTVLASASTELGGVLAIAGFTRVGEAILRQAIDVAARAGDQGALAYAHLVSSLYSIGTGDWQSADSSARFCQELCEPMDDAVNWTNAQAIRYWIAHYRGQLEIAEMAARRLQDRARETGNRQHQAWSMRYLAQCAFRRKDPAKAEELLTAALDALGETAALNERIPAIALLALALLEQGSIWAARARAGDGLALISRVRRPIGHGVLEGYSALTQVVLDAWQREPAASNWKGDALLCLKVLRRYRAAFPIGEARYRLWHGRYLELAGRDRQAAASYRRGAAAAERFGMGWEQAACSEALERMRP